MITLTLALALAAQGPIPLAQAKTPIELGKVDWNRDFDAAVALAKRKKQPLLVLFQEVPG